MCSSTCVGLSVHFGVYLWPPPLRWLMASELQRGATRAIVYVKKMENGSLSSQCINTRRIYSRGSGCDRPLNKWTAASGSPLTQRALPARSQHLPPPPPPPPFPIRQTARCVYLGTADQRLLNISKVKSIIHEGDKRLLLGIGPIFEENISCLLHKYVAFFFCPPMVFITACVLLFFFVPRCWESIRCRI